MAGWYYNSTRIYVQDFGKNQKQIIARLQPLASGTILQVFGYESPIIQLTGKVVGETNLNALQNLVTTGSAYTLSGYEFVDTLYLANFSYKRDLSVRQTLDITQDCEANVYTVTMELYK